MPSYKVVVKKSAAKEIKKLPKSAAGRIVKILQELAYDPRPTGCKKLKGYSNLWRIRSGSYRIIYAIHDDKLMVHVLETGDRKDMY